MVDGAGCQIERLNVGAADFEALRAWARELTRDYDAGDFDPRKETDLKQAKRDRAYFNGLAKDIDQRRKAVKAAYDAPLKTFEDGCKSVTDILKGAAEQAGAVVAEGDRLYREEKRRVLREFFEDFAGELANVVSFEQIADPAWLNRTFAIKDAQDEIARRLNGVARDWEVLARFAGTPGHAAARETFRETLSLGEALKALDEARAEGESPKAPGTSRADWEMRVFDASDLEIAQILQLASSLCLAVTAERQKGDGHDE